MAKILVVDDAEFLRVRISRMLSSEGYEITEAENGAQAIDAYQNEKPDVVLMDITMPEMDGLTPLREIQKIDPNAKIVMLTALGQESVVLERFGTSRQSARRFEAPCRCQGLCTV